MDIKLFVCCHKPVNVPKHPLLVPLQVGAALAGEHFPGFLHDDAGDSISEKNRSYCELTGQYWAWKNIKADYYGLCHYRRYFSFSAEKLEEDVWNNISCDFIDDKAIKKLENYEGKMRSIICSHDIILSSPFICKDDVYKQYKKLLCS